MKNKKLTFAQRANKIKNSYKGRENDSISQDSMERELSALMQEQEQYKQENNKQNSTPEFAYGGGLDGEIGDSLKMSGINAEKYNNDNINTNGLNSNSKINKVDYNTYFPQKDSSGNEFYITRATTNNMNNPDFSKFDDGYVSFTDAKYVPDHGNYQPINYDKKNNNVSFMANPHGDTSRFQAASEGRLDLDKLDEYKNGGNLKKYRFGDPLNSNMDNTIDDALLDEDTGYEPSYNWQMPTALSATNAISNYLGSKSKQESKDRLLSQQDNLFLGRTTPQKIDLGRERSSIRQNRDLGTAMGRRRSSGSTSLAEASNIERASALGSQRIAGQQLGQSFSKEELANMQARQQSDQYNAQMYSQEQQIGNRNRMAIEQMYGNPSQDWIPQTIKSTGQSYTNAMAEQKKQQEYYDYLNMISRDYKLNKDRKLGLR